MRLLGIKVPFMISLPDLETRARSCPEKSLPFVSHLLSEKKVVPVSRHIKNVTQMDGEHLAVDRRIDVNIATAHYCTAI